MTDTFENDKKQEESEVQSLMKICQNIINVGSIDLFSVLDITIS